MCGLAEKEQPEYIPGVSYLNTESYHRTRGLKQEPWSSVQPAQSDSLDVKLPAAQQIRPVRYTADHHNMIAIE